MSDELPIADLGRTEMAESIFSKYQVMSPEEWAARYSHRVGASSFGDYRYENLALHLWIHRLHEIFRSPEEIKMYRDKFLTKEEIQKIQANEQEDF